MRGEILELSSEIARNISPISSPPVENLGLVSRTISVAADFLSTTLGKYVTVIGVSYEIFDFFHFLGITEGYPRDVEAVGVLSYLAEERSK